MMTQVTHSPIDLREEFPHLRDAPVVEAVLLFNVAPNPPLEREAVSALLPEMFPDYPDVHPLHVFHMHANVTGDGPTISHTDGWHGFQLTSADKLNICQVLRDGFGFNRLAPYTSWNHFIGEAGRLWGLYREQFRPEEIQRIGLRFINRIAIATPADALEFLAQPPETIASLGLPLSSYMFQSVHDFPFMPLQIKVSQAIQPPSGDAGFGLIIDLDVFTTKTLSMDEGTVETYLDAMRWLKDKTFFSIIKESALRHFNPGEPC